MGTTINGIYIPDDGENSWGTLVSNNLRRQSENHVNVKAYGAVGDGVADDGTALTNAIAAMPATGATLYFPPATYLSSSQLTITADQAHILAPGATIKTSGAISGLKFSVAHTNRITGLTIDHSGNANATYGFEVAASSRNVFDQCRVIGDASLQANYAAWRLYNSNGADSATGSFWTRLRDCFIFASSGTKPFPVGIQLEGDSNHTVIDGGIFGNCVTTIKLMNMGSNTAIPNSVVIRDNDISSTTNGIVITSSQATSNILGLNIHSNRFESVSGPILTLSGITTQPSIPPSLLFNQYAGAPGSYISNTNNLNVHAIDPSITPNLGAESLKLFAGTQTNPLRLFQTDADKVRIMSGTTEIGRMDATGSAFNIHDTSGNGVKFTGTRLAFFAGTPQVKLTVTGSRGANAALASLLTQLVSYGLITDSTTA